VKHVIWKRADGDGLEHLPELLESVASIYGDEDLSQDEREAMLAQTFELYADFTGRDGLEDLAATRGEAEDKEPEMQDIDKSAVALLAFEGLATELLKREPHLSKEQAFARVYSDPANAEFAKIERQASRARLYEGATSRSGTPRERVDPKILDDLSDEEVKRLIAEQRREHPFETPEQLYARVYNSPAMVEHRAKFRAAQRAAERDGATWLSASVAKRDDAHDAIAAKAAELRKIMPTLTFEQAYAKTFSDPANREIAKAERRAAREALYG
jgi:hypothetical protein